MSQEHCQPHHHHEHPHHHSHEQQQEENCNMPEKLLCLADEAWMEVLKEKIKKEIEATSGEKLTKLAKLIAETNGAKWQAKIAAKKGCHEYKEKLFRLLAENQ